MKNTPQTILIEAAGLQLNGFEASDLKVRNHFNNLRRTTLSTCVAAAIAGGSSHGVLAQEGSSSTELEEVVVTAVGYRKSIRDAIDTKRYSSSVVEAISAEDIGKLPDSSIAESIARLPGLAAQRLDGRASSISVRGFNEDFSTTTFNGREQVSIDDNRGVQFDVYPSEIMSGVTVYKTPNAALPNKIASAVSMRTEKIPATVVRSHLWTNLRMINWALLWLSQPWSHRTMKSVGMPGAIQLIATATVCWVAPSRLCVLQICNATQ